MSGSTSEVRWDDTVQIGDAVALIESPDTITDLGEGSPLDALDWGSPLSDTHVTVYFAQAGEVFDGQESLAWSEYEKLQMMAALEQYASVSNLTFEIVTEPDDATFRLVVHEDDLVDTGYARMYPSEYAQGGVGVFNRHIEGWGEHDGEGLAVGSLSFMILMHEIGHGLGLAHPHDEGGDSTTFQGITSGYGDYGDYDLSQNVFTIMSYNEGYSSELGGLPSSDFGTAGSLSPFDIAIIQQLYGAAAANEGDNVYMLPDQNEEGTYFQAIWDTGGEDMIAYAGSLDVTIDLRAATIHYEEGGGGFVSFADGIHGGFTIAQNVVIENASGGSGDDLIIGNETDNDLYGNSGNDRLEGNEGSDVLDGGLGNDVMIGGAGEDELVSLAGRNTLIGGAGYDLLIGGFQSDALYGGAGNDILIGDAGNGFYAGSDILVAGAGEDLLDGGGGSDRFIFAPSQGGKTIADIVISADDEATITGADFQSGEDVIDLTSFEGIHEENVFDFISQGEDGAIFSAQGTSITFYGVDAASISEQDFLF